MNLLKRIAEMCSRERRRVATIAAVLAACLVAYHAVFGANGMLMYQQKKTEYRALQQKRDALQKENDRLAQENLRLKSDPAAIEREARQNLHYTRPGEVVFVTPGPEPPTPRQPATAKK